MYAWGEKNHFLETKTLSSCTVTKEFVYSVLRNVLPNGSLLTPKRLI